MNNDKSRNKKIWVVDHPFTCQFNMDIAKGWEVIKMHIINGSIHCWLTHNIIAIICPHHSVTIAPCNTSTWMNDGRNIDGHCWINEYQRVRFVFIAHCTSFTPCWLCYLPAVGRPDPPTDRPSVITCHNCDQTNRPPTTVRSSVRTMLRHR